LDQERLARVGLRVEALNLATTVAGVWIALAARLTPANEADGPLAPLLLEELPDEARFVLGDTHYNAPEVRESCESQENASWWPRGTGGRTRTPMRGWGSGASSTS
jgi:hypothetical protein